MSGLFDGAVDQGRMDLALEYYATPDPFTHWLSAWLLMKGFPLVGTCFEPCVGDGAIVRAANGPGQSWVTNDLDPRWTADSHLDATQSALWSKWSVDWTVDNPPFTAAIEIIDHALAASRFGVAMHLRASIHEVLKTGVRRTWMREHPPTAILWLPRFAYQRSKSKGKWSTDSVCACWCVWLKGCEQQWIDYSPPSVIDALDAFTPAYRDRMDAIMGFTGSEADRERQCVRRAA